MWPVRASVDRARAAGGVTATAVLLGETGAQERDETLPDAAGLEERCWSLSVI